MHLCIQLCDSFARLFTKTFINNSAIHSSLRLHPKCVILIWLQMLQKERSRLWRQNLKVRLYLSCCDQWFKLMRWRGETLFRSFSHRFFRSFSFSFFFTSIFWKVILACMFHQCTESERTDEENQGVTQSVAVSLGNGRYNVHGWKRATKNKNIDK